MLLSIRNKGLFWVDEVEIAVRIARLWYLASTLERATKICFLDYQDTRVVRKKYASTKSETSNINVKCPICIPKGSDKVLILDWRGKPHL